MTVRSLNDIDVDGRALAFGMLAGVVTSLLFGLPPAIIGSRPNLNGVLRRESGNSAGSGSSRKLRSALVVAEVTIAIVLLVGAALMTRSFLKLQSVERGFDTAGLVTFRIGFPTGPYADGRVRDHASDDLVASFARLPGVSSATVGAVPPATERMTFGKLEIAGSTGELSDELVVPIYRVWPNYFSAVGLLLKEGRPFAADEPAESVIVSESFARKFWPGRSSLGSQFRLDGASRWAVIVGVSTEVRQANLDDALGSFEWFQPLKTAPGATSTPRPLSSQIAESRTFVIRADDVPATIPRLRAAAHGLDSRLVMQRTALVDDQFDTAVAQPRLVFVLLLVFSGLGLGLAAAGIYGVLSCLVTQRLREIGVRLALGASPVSVFTLILRSGLGLTTIGLVLGLGASYYLVRVMGSVLYEVEPSDPTAVVGVSVLLICTAALACWRPARRAMRVDPISLLREQ
jgi:predicted permease